MAKFRTLEDFHREAQRKLPKEIFDFIEGGADDEICIRHNREVLSKIKLIPQRLRSETGMNGDTSPTLIVAPLGLCGAVWPNGDLAIARAAMKEGVPYILSTASNASVEQIAAVSDGDKWFQLYALSHDFAFSLMDRAFKSDYSTLVITVDVPANGNRERDLLNGFNPASLSLYSKFKFFLKNPAWAIRLLMGPKLVMGNLQSASVSDSNLSKRLLQRDVGMGLTWEDIKIFRDRWPRRFIVKGLLSSADIQEATRLGVDGVVLSNHGGRQLDSAVSPMQALARLGHLPMTDIYIDGGFRRGSDIVKARALGARSVLVGRPLMYGLAVGGEDGAREILRIIKTSVANTLVQLGCVNMSDVTRDVVWNDVNSI